MMELSVPAAISAQVDQALRVIERRLGCGLLAVHLYGSALDGRLRPESDIDLLVTADAPLDEGMRQALMCDLLAISAPPGRHEEQRALEVTMLLRGDVVPWRYPDRRELQFGEWLREDIAAGVFEPATIDPDIAILLTKARLHSVALIGPSAADLFDPVPEISFQQALADTLMLWNVPADWAGDERNVVLTLARIWYSVATGKIVTKDAAAEWAIERSPAECRPILRRAADGYLGGVGYRFPWSDSELAGLVALVKKEVAVALAR